MKKILLVVLVLFGLQTQAQINICDSVTISGSQFQILIEINNINTIMEYWETTGSNGLFTLSEDTLTNQHSVYNVNPVTQISYDTLLTCANTNWMTCCWTFIWDGASWARMGMATGIKEVDVYSKKCLKMFDVLGREVTEVPVGTMYIRNNKKHIRIK